MDSNKIKKIILVLAFGGAIYMLGSWALEGDVKDIESVPKGKTVWVKCSNPACGSSYEMNLREYYKQVEQKFVVTQIPPINCKNCGKESIFRAVKCKKCGEVFSPPAGRDQCPKCGFSETEGPAQQ